jgi:hypothetical protein
LLDDIVLRDVDLLLERGCHIRRRDIAQQVTSTSSYVAMDAR